MGYDKQMAGKKGGFGQGKGGVKSGAGPKPSGESSSGGFVSGKPQMRVKEEAGKQAGKNQGFGSGS